ncbi:hypothetical protein B0H11DRAFT_1909456 [Mycena galericulata]|nr:hypothetical protein B0H11DRAFT_1909456 [Mycena galericulata]
MFAIFSGTVELNDLIQSPGANPSIPETNDNFIPEQFLANFPAHSYSNALVKNSSCMLSDVVRVNVKRNAEANKKEEAGASNLVLDTNYAWKVSIIQEAVDGLNPA